MTEPLATFSDVSDRMPGADLDPNYVTVLLDDASVIVRAAFPDIDGRLGSGLMDALSVRSVVARMVRRAVLAPKPGVQTETAGPFALTYQNPDGDLYLVASERAILGAGSAASSGARSVRMGY